MAASQNHQPAGETIDLWYVIFLLFRQYFAYKPVSGNKKFPLLFLLHL